MFRIRILLTAAALTACAFASSAAAQLKIVMAPPAASKAVALDATKIPFGWVDFCARYRGECDVPSLPPVDISFTPEVWSLLSRVNRQVNAEIEPVSDPDHWGVPDRWDYPDDGKGDCEDYALLKRKRLMQAGLPRQALLMTVVLDKKGEGHAVLTVVTDRGDFILDNQEDRILPWTATGYKFRKRQSQENPNIWVDIGPGSAAVATGAHR